VTGYIPRSLYNQYINSCDILWLPLLNSNANRGRLPIKLSDYATAGKPILATAVGDLPMYLGGAQSESICPAQADALADRIFQLSQHPETLIHMAHQSAHLAKDPSLSWASQSQRLGKIYQAVLHHRTNSHQ
jgi:glycosyltransferase involved in cell wall biosynthesis